VVTIFDLRESACRWWLDHLSSQLSNSIHDLFKVPRSCLSRSPPCDVNHSESLFMLKSMNKQLALRCMCGCYL
jgi:hypothetical protein